MNTAFLSEVWQDHQGLVIFSFCVVLAQALVIAMLLVYRRRNQETTRLLRESEASLQRFRFISDSSPSMIWIADVKHLCTWVNKTWLTFRGLSMAQELGMGWMMGIHSDDIEACTAHIESHFDARKPFSIEYRLMRHDGQYRWILDMGQPMLDADGAFTGYVGTCIDVTERKQLELEREMFQTFFSMSQEMMAITGYDGYFKRVNHAFTEVLGYTREELLARPFYELIMPEDRQATQDEIQKQFNGGVTRQFQNRYCCKDGTIRILSWNAIADQTRQVRYATARDVTDLRAAQGQLTRLGLAMEQTSQSVIITNKDACIEYVNRAFCEISGYVPEEIIGQNPRMLQSGLTPKDTYTRMWAALGRGDTWQGEFTNRRKNGALYVESVLISPVRQLDGSISHFLALKEDITERLRKEEEQKSLEKQLQQAQKMEVIGHLTGGIAHDFNNILASILGYAEIIHMSADSTFSPKSRDYVREILQAGIRAKELVQQLLTFSQRRDTAVEAIHALPIVKEVIKLLQSTLPKSINITMHMTAAHQELPQVMISSVQLHQILMNLGVNARNAIETVGTIAFIVEPVTLEVDHYCHSCHQNFTGDYLMIGVQDSGAGIPEHIRLRVFDPFFTTRAVGLGSGLGLSVVHGIVHAAKGHIGMHTEAGKGTDMRIYLPAYRGDTARHVQHAEAHTEVLASTARVLVVDDEQAIVGVATALLESMGCEVVGFTYPAEALRMFYDKPNGFDLVITDLTMPELSGAELARTMLSIRPELPIIMCSGYSAALDETAALEIGIRRFLMKPVPAKVLLDAVKKCLAQRLTLT
ncbi:MAG: PAS domain S-box protein [Rhodoferax sp.]|nr:PAS domain S-box protein [Rhodoferax sp.]